MQALNTKQGIGFILRVLILFAFFNNSQFHFIIITDIYTFTLQSSYNNLYFLLSPHNS